VKKASDHEKSGRSIRHGIGGIQNEEPNCPSEGVRERIGVTDAERKLVYEQAADWLLELEAAPKDAGLRQAFEAWVDAHPLHAKAWSRVASTWFALGEPLEPKAVGHVSAPSKAVHRSRTARGTIGPSREASIWRRIPVRGRVASGVFLALTVLAFLPFAERLQHDDYTTGIGETHLVTLDDGSMVYLAPDSAIDVDFTPDQRLLHLKRGEAFFDVNKDPARPFKVETDHVTVSVVGTAFDVRLSDDSLAVEVEHGIVSVHNNAVSGLEQDDLRLTAGQSVSIDFESGKADRYNAPAEMIAGWREGLLMVEGVTIGDVVDTLQRYKSGWIVFGDQKLSEGRVTGLYDLRDPDRALNALVKAHDGKVTQVTPFLMVLSFK
jgi:transmembrane sensor